METEHDPPRDAEEGVDEATGALNEDNPEPPDEAGQKGAGDATGAIGGLQHGSEPDDEEAREHERP
jgi:hypothetical protein